MRLPVLLPIPFLLLLISLTITRCAVIVSQEQSVVMLNGVQQMLSTVTVDFGPADEGVPFTLDVVNPQTGSTDTLVFVHEPPLELYTHQLAGWIPRAVYGFNDVACLYPTNPVNSTAMSSPSVANANVAGGSYLSTSSSFVARSKNVGVQHALKRQLPPKFLPKRPLPQGSNGDNTRPVNATAEREHRRAAIQNITTFRTMVPQRKEAHKAPSVLLQKLKKTVERGSVYDGSGGGGAFDDIPSTVVGDTAASSTSLSRRLLTGGLSLGSMVVLDIGITFAINELCSSGVGSFLGDLGLCGSGGNAALIAAVKQLQTMVNQEQKEITSLGNTVASIEQWDDQEQATTNSLLAGDQVISNEVTGILQDISDQQQDINSLEQVTYSFINQTNNNFGILNSEIGNLSNVEQQIVNFTNTLANVTQTEINYLTSQVSSVDQAVMLLAMQVYSLSQNTGVSRALIANLWANIFNAPTPLPSCVFSQCIGSPPLPPTGSPYVYENAANCPATPSSCSYLVNQVPTVNILSTASNPAPPQNQEDTHNLYSAGMLSMVRLQYTDSEAGMAYERQISYDCDKIFLLDDYIPGINFQYMLGFIGPPYNGSSYCYNTAEPGTATWSCNCVVVETYSYCALASGAPDFPWGWNQTGTLQYSPQVSQYCTSEGVQTSGLVSESFGTQYGIETDGMIFSSITNFGSFLTALCQSSSGWVVSPSGKRVRVVSDTVGGFIDMTLNGDVCTSDLATLTNANNQTDYMAFNVYSFWSQGYQAVSTVLAAYWNEQIFGTMMTDIDWQYDEFNQRPDIQQTGQCTTGQVIKYAGTGIELEQTYEDTLIASGLSSHPDDLNPSNVTDSDVYPPKPDFTQAYTAEGNSNKLPVYVIAPIEQSYNPTLTINGGSCVVANGTCATPLNGLNFSTSLSTIVALEWENLLPNERLWVGDFNQGYNADGGQVVIDAPLNLLPQSYSRSSVCNSLVYLLQPRTSSYASDSLFNIPDTDYETQINAVDWVSFYNTTFVPSCASESAYSYARVVDSNGICQQAVYDNGTVSDTIASNFDSCTLMSAYYVYVPNYVSAFMYFQPREYTVQATFSIPQGTLVQNVSTSCPTSYSVNTNSQNNTVSLIFYTTSNATEAATFTVTSYGGACAGTQTYQFQYSASNPYTFGNIAACGTQYGQVYPYLSNQPCYGSPGIEMYMSYSSNDGPVTPVSTVSYVTDVTSSATDALVNLMISLASQSNQLATLASTANSEDEVLSGYSQAISNQIASISNTVATTNLTSTSEQSIKTTAAQVLNNNSASVTAGLVAQYQLLQTYNNITSMAAESNAKAQVLNAASQQAIIQTQSLINYTNVVLFPEENAKVTADLKKASEGGSCSGICCIIIIHTLCSMLDGIEGAISSVIMIIVIIVVFVCICCCCYKLGIPMFGKLVSYLKTSHSDPRPLPPATSSHFQTRGHVVRRGTNDDDDYEGDHSEQRAILRSVASATFDDVD